MIPYLERELISQYAAEARNQYTRATQRPLKFPLNVENFAYALFNLEVVYDTEGHLNNIETGIIGCLFPDAHPSPFNGKDKIVAVNLSPTPGFDPTRFGSLHTIAHETMGHYVLHFLKGISGEKVDRPSYCRTGAKDRLEWQADFAAGELTQPADRVAWLLDGKQPGEVINIELYEKSYRECFGATRTGMEKRLQVLGYRMVMTKNEWAGPTVESLWCQSRGKKRGSQKVPK